MAGIQDAIAIQAVSSDLSVAKAQVFDRHVQRLANGLQLPWDLLASRSGESRNATSVTRATGSSPRPTSSSISTAEEITSRFCLYRARPQRAYARRMTGEK